MTLIGNFNYDIRPYSGYSDPGLPIGSYIAQGGLAGDASGGNVIFNFDFMCEQDELITEMFNLEAFEFDTDSGNAELGMMETVNMDTLSRNRSASKRKWQVQTTDANTSDSAVSLQDSLPRPIWLGAPNLDARAGTAALRIIIPQTNLRLYAITIQGYIWGSRSILAEGGPRRPVGGGIFGS